MKEALNALALMVGYGTIVLVIIFSIVFVSMEIKWKIKRNSEIKYDKSLHISWESQLPKKRPIEVLFN